jgi:glutamine amidotransferase
MRILVVDYGMGNINSIESTLRFCGVENIEIANDEESFKKADKIILPGVGSYAKAMSIIRNLKIDEYVHHEVIINKKPILGICLGMQIMGLSSDEEKITEGLGLIKTQVRKFPDSNLKIPHVGFNQVTIDDNLKIFSDFSSKSPDFYFTHSYRMLVTKEIKICTTNYIEPFTAAFEDNNITGVQFHPELSQTNGIKLLKNFLNKF